MKQTAVEWLRQELLKRDMDISIKDLFEQAKEMENQRMIDLVQYLKDYTRESHNILGFDDRESSEFVEIFKQQEQ